MNRITLNGKIIETEFRSIEISYLQFWPENPRIYSILRESTTENPTQEEIYEKLLSFDDHVKELIQQIKKNDGLIEPVLVKKTDGITFVYEGNSRLAAYKKLAELDPIKWGKINCNILPSELTDSEIFNLIGQYHIHTKKDWVPYERAGYLYRRHVEQKFEITVIAKEMMMSESRIKKDITTYGYMLQYKCTNTAKWSYFDEYLKLAPIQRLRKRVPELDDVVFKKIAKDEITSAIDIRNKLNKIAELSNKKPKIGEKAVKELVINNKTIDEVFDSIEDHIFDNKYISNIEKFNKLISEPVFFDNIIKAEKGERDKIKYELNKINKNIESVLRKLINEGQN